jgi:hypothetical protein
MMFHRQLLPGIALAAALFPAYGWQTPEQKIQELDGKIEDLDQRLKVAERLRELKDEERDTKAKSAALVTADSGGVIIGWFSTGTIWRLQRQGRRVQAQTWR